jgi:hypothetical protein
MPHWLPGWAPFVLILSTVALFQWLRARKRKEALTEVAQGLGFTFEAKDWASDNSTPQLESRHFSSQRKHRFRNTITGERLGLNVSFFDHVIGGKGGHTDTIAAFTQSINLPEFVLAQQNIVDKIVDAMLHRRIDFPSDPAFSERFRLVGKNESRVCDLFTVNMRQFLTSIEPIWQIEASGQTLFIYWPNKTVKPEEFIDFVNRTTEIAKEFFNHCHLKEFAI